MEGIENKLFFADDTTVYIDEDKDSQCRVMGILGWFKKMSGIGVNKEKTTVNHLSIAGTIR